MPTPPTTPGLFVPPPVSGGTLLVTRNDAALVAADPDRDAVWIVDHVPPQVRSRVNLDAGSEPGRVVEDSDGKIHVALRRGGKVAKLDPATGTIESLRPVCPAPRGLAYDAATDNLHAACQSGELVTLKARGGDVTRSLQLDSDLRDVVVRGDHLLVSRFRSAQVLEVDATGTLIARVQPRTVTPAGALDATGKPQTASPTVGWRMVGLPTGEALMLHQRGVNGVLSTKQGGYAGGFCMGVAAVTPALTVYGSGGTGGTVSVDGGAMAGMAALAVDVAVAPDMKTITLIGAGGVMIGRTMLAPTDPCDPSGQMPFPSQDNIAGAYDSQGNLVVQSRNPARLYYPASGVVIDFPNAEDRSDDGHRLFHTPTKGMIACASCHPEGGDDGHVWTFDTVGPRRTQNLRGGLLSTAPFHWDGDMTDMTMLMAQVFTGRMGGQALDNNQVGSVGHWLDAQPALPRPTVTDGQSVARGRALFNDPSVGCAVCHSGAHLTNNQNVDVGTGRSLQVPSLVGVSARAPYMHSGCAATLKDRFNPACGGGDLHGHTSQLGAGDVDDLVAYLKTL